MTFAPPAWLFPASVTITPAPEGRSDGLGAPEVPALGTPRTVRASVQRGAQAPEGAGEAGPMYRQSYTLFFAADPGLGLGDLLAFVHEGVAVAAMADGPAVAQAPGGFGGAYEATCTEIGPDDDDA